MNENENETITVKPRNRTLEFIKKNRTGLTFTAINTVLLITIWVVGGRNVTRMEASPHDQGWNEGYNQALDGVIEYANLDHLATKK